MRADKVIQFMRAARFDADEFSKDSSTKVSAVLVDSTDFTELTQGHNGMPRGVTETDERKERPLKYSVFEHAERNALYNLARRWLRGSVAVLTYVPSLSCVRALISVGTTEVVVPVSEELTPQWALSLAMFEETGVTVRYATTEVLQLPGEEDSPQLARHLRKLGQNLRKGHARKDIFCKDPQGNAAVFLSQGDYTLLTLGYSGMPRGADDTRTERYSGPAREYWVESSVRNAIYSLLRPQLKGSTAIVTATPCAECARALAGVAVAKVFYVQPDAEFVKRWGDSIGPALATLQELGVEVTALSPEVLDSRG
jgi:dCMP deaminase